MQRISSSSMEGLRSVVHPDYAGMKSAALEQVVDDSIDALPDDVAENFLTTLGSLGKAAAPLAQRLGPGVAQGAASGAGIGGPWGALIGAGAGLASGALGGRGKPRTAAPIAGAAVGAAPSPVMPPSLPTGPAAAGTLLGLLQSPVVQQALLSQVLGQAGARQIATPSGVDVPRAAINGLLSQLLANATEGLPESEDVAEQDYLQGADGEFLIDPASLEQQAALVLAKLKQTFGTRSPFSEQLSEDSPSGNWAMADAVDDAVEFY